MKGVDQPWEHEGNVLRIGPSDFREEYRERNWNIYNMCVLEKRTLSFAAEQQMFKSHVNLPFTSLILQHHFSRPVTGLAVPQLFIRLTCVPTE